MATTISDKSNSFGRWQFIKERQIDREFGGVFDTIEADGTVKDNTKSRIWKECYHDARALLNTIARLRKLSEQI